MNPRVFTDPRMTVVPVSAVDNVSPSLGQEQGIRDSRFVRGYEVREGLSGFEGKDTRGLCVSTRGPQNKSRESPKHGTRANTRSHETTRHTQAYTHRAGGKRGRSDDAMLSQQKEGKDRILV